VKQRVALLAVTSFPRWVGVARLYRARKPILDVLFDTTESDLGFPVLAVVVRDPACVPQVPGLRAAGFAFPVLP
jgi:hypothetical protein